jgi:hypothetical protein
MKNTLVVLALAGSILTLTACDSKLTPVTTCETADDLQPICRFSNPEDIELLPDHRTLLISQMGNMEGSKPGNLVSFDTTSQAITPLFPTTVANTAGDNWGTSNCPGLPDTHFSPHGISLRQRNDGRWQLAVINHGGRETVEMFEVLQDNNTYSLAWRGCVVPPEGTYMNDVALMKDGGMVASHMFDKRLPTLFGISTGIWKSQLHMDTGYALEWQPAHPQTFRVLAESHGPFINGILVSADDSTVFESVYAGNEIRKLDLASGKQLGSIHIQQVDNMAWDESGGILAASHTGKALDQKACLDHPGETCGFGFTIVHIDPKSLATKDVLKHEGAPMGAATVAKQAGDAIYLGSFSGNRIVKAPYR